MANIKTELAFNVLFQEKNGKKIQANKFWSLIGVEGLISCLQY